MAMYGTPGPVYIDLPADILHGVADANDIYYQPLVEHLPPTILRNTEIE